MVERVLNEDKLCITLGGDHSIGIGTIQGFTKAYSQSCLLWIDAHADINTMENSDSGNMHGMPVSFNLQQFAKQNKVDQMAAWFQPKLQANRVAFIGLRCVDPAEREALNRLNIPAFSMREVDEMGIREVR